MKGEFVWIEWPPDLLAGVSPEPEYAISEVVRPSRYSPEEPCNRCSHQFRHHAVTVDGYRCRGCKCKRSHWR